MLRAPPRQLSLIALVHAGNGSGLPASWRHPEAATDVTSASYYAGIARTLETACFDLALFEDHLLAPLKGRAATTLGQRMGDIRLDPVVAAQAMGLATDRLGIGLPFSPQRHEPTQVARTLSSLDLMLGGRVAWNMGADAAGSRRLCAEPRQAHAQQTRQYLQAVQNHGARALSPQGAPVLMLDTLGGHDLVTAARHAELVFARYPNLGVATWAYAKFKSLVAEAGREPALVKVAPMVHTVVGVTRWMAEDKLALLNSLCMPEDRLTLLSKSLEIDLSARPMDAAFSESDIADNEGLRATCERITVITGQWPVTLSDLLKHDRTGTVAELPTFVGTPAEIANEIEAWFGPAADAFVIAPTHAPGGYEDFARLVVPELQRRGLFRHRYESRTLRGHLGLPLPEPGNPVLIPG